MSDPVLTIDSPGLEFFDWEDRPMAAKDTFSLFSVLSDRTLVPAPSGVNRADMDSNAWAISKEEVEKMVLLRKAVIASK